tara:strand:- start:4520 stop:5260 length:741 start_codon:yes stop_codon:yes gene_type:complete
MTRVEDCDFEGRVVVNWKTCNWQPYPAIDGGETDLMWNPVRAEPGPGDGTYLLKVAPGGGAKLHQHSGQEEFVVLDGELVDGDGTVLKTGDVVSYNPGTRHRTNSPKGCILMVWIQEPIDTVEGDDELEAMKEGRTIVNWQSAAFTRYPSLPETADPIDWHKIRADPATGQGLSLIQFFPGTSSALHEHTGWEEFVVLQGELSDPDGTTYVTGDVVSLPPGSRHGSHSGPGCITAVVIERPLLSLV